MNNTYRKYLRNVNYPIIIIIVIKAYIWLLSNELDT